MHFWLHTPFYIMVINIILTGLFSCLVVQASPPLQLGLQVGFNDAREDPVIRSDRLSRSIVPSNYQLEIRPILENEDETQSFTAPGIVRIRIKCLEPTNEIELHSLNIDIDEEGVKVTPVSGDPILTPSSHSYNLTKQTYAIGLDTTLRLNEEYILEIPFVARVSNDLDGLYRSSYQTADGQTRYLATTQFQKLGARKAFPCFDEPALRATFDVKIARDQANGYHSLFCTELIREPTPIEELPGWVWDEYETTVNMPTYLIAIIVSDFTAEEAPTGLYHKPIRTWGPPPMMNEEDSAKFSAQVAAKIINFFEIYFDFPYEVSKMDSVAIPDFAAGAMENWGLNTYRIAYMLFFKGESTQFEQWRQAAVISHELSHQWFGNLVTNDWWNDLWLNEGFARYLQFVGVDTTEPQLESMNRVVLDTIQLAMEYDAGANSVPVHSSVIDQVVNVPSRIAYEKGASLIRTMNAFLTESTLIKGLRTYLKNNAYGNAVQDQLFAELQLAADEDRRLPDGITVKDIMDTWTLQTGFPLIKVYRVSANRIFISQEKFLTPANSNMDPNDLWYVPVTYATKSNPDFSENNWTPKLWLNKTTLITSTAVPSTNEWLFVNPDARSYYRVMYDSHFTSLLKQQLDEDHEVFSSSSRSQLFDDYFKLAFTNYIPIAQALDFTTYLNNENTLVVWATVLNNLRKTYTLLRDTPNFDKFKTYILNKIDEPLRRIGGNQLEGESPIKSMLRAQLLDWACGMSHELCHDTSRTLIQQWMENSNVNPIAADIQPMIYCGAVASAEGNGVSDFIKERYTVNKSDRQNTLLLNSLGCSSSEENLLSYLELTLDETSSFHKQSLLINKIAENSIAHDLVYRFLTDKKSDIIEKLGASAISSAISTMSQYLSTTARITQLEEYILDNDDLPDNIQVSLRNSVEVIRQNKIWSDMYIENIMSWLDNQNNMLEPKLK